MLSVAVHVAPCAAVAGQRTGLKFAAAVGRAVQPHGVQPLNVPVHTPAVQVTVDVTVPQYGATQTAEQTDPLALLAAQPVAE